VGADIELELVTWRLWWEVVGSRAIACCMGLRPFWSVGFWGGNILRKC